MSDSQGPSKPGSRSSMPPDWAERRHALDPARSFLVQAPAGSGKTYLLTQRFLRLLALAGKPEEIVAITFTNAAAAEMRNRILSELEQAEALRDELTPDADPESLPALARAALDRAYRLGWRLLDQPSQLRITTIDAFHRGLALQSPLSWGLLASLGGRLDPVSSPQPLYRQAARRTLEALAGPDNPIRPSVEALLAWRDNHWADVEDLLVDMLAVRNRWYREFVFARQVDWAAVRLWLEAPFRRANRDRLETLCRILDGLPGCSEYALQLVRAACESPGKSSPLTLAERVELPASFPLQETVQESASLEDAIAAYRDLANFLLTAKGEWRKEKGLTLHQGFPATPSGREAKKRFGEFVDSLAQEPGLQAALAAMQSSAPVRYTDGEWELVRHCFAVLRVAYAHLQTVFVETGAVDFIEVAQLSLGILAPQDGLPSDFALRQADGIHHLLIDEFQDTSHDQHRLLHGLTQLWPDHRGRSCFCVGDPLQSIYGFRDAEVELFERTRVSGLTSSAAGVDPQPFRLDFIALQTNFRTVPSLVNDLNGRFGEIFSADESGVRFSPVAAARESASTAKTELHLTFTVARREEASGVPAEWLAAQTAKTQLQKIVRLIQGKLQEASALREAGDPKEKPSKFRIAVLGRTRAPLIRIAEALRAAGIGYRAIDLTPLRQRPEVLDVLSLVRALLNPADRTAWLGILRAPWCGLSLEELHLLTSADDPAIAATPISKLLATRLHSLYREGRLDARAFAAAARTGKAISDAIELRASACSLGTWLETAWKMLGGNATVNREERENLGQLWAALDKLPEGEADLLGPGLDSALDELFALPDPEASADFGVQLMTIHKSKGLEFEVVLVPDLEAATKKDDPALMSWLERGIANPNAEEAALTEFLIAPIQAKGKDSGDARQWVEHVKRERAAQELRRLLYVAATRAREELHLFARPRFAIGKASGLPELAHATGLLATAWPALGPAIEAQFAAWVESNPAKVAEPTLDLAAAADLTIMPLRPKPTMLKRLPADYAAPPPGWTAARPEKSSSANPDSGEPQSLFARAEGGLESRLLGAAVHSLLETLARARGSLDSAAIHSHVQEQLPSLVSQMRGHGLARHHAAELSSEAGRIAHRAALDPAGAWILAPHAEGETESRWTGIVRNAAGRAVQWNLRPDRVFLAPANSLPGVDPAAGAGHPVWWIVDYKTSHADGFDLNHPSVRQRFLETHRERHRDQLAAYAQVLRSLRRIEAHIAIRAGIYYPRLLLFDFWEC